MEADADRSDYMLVFKGKIHFNPTTLNNWFFAYFLAHSLQKDPSYKYSQWEDLVRKTYKIEADLETLINSKP